MRTTYIGYSASDGRAQRETERAQQLATATFTPGEAIEYRHEASGTWKPGTVVAESVGLNAVIVRTATGETDAAITRNVRRADDVTPEDIELARAATLATFDTPPARDEA